jgi:hypothetical protein
LKSGGKRIDIITLDAELGKNCAAAAKMNWMAGGSRPLIPGPGKV